MLEVSYSEARGCLAELLDQVADDREVVRIRRQGGKPAAVLVDADEYASLEETAYLLSSPANVRHLLQSLAELETGQGRSYESVDDLWRDLETAEEPHKAELRQTARAVDTGERNQPTSRPAAPQRKRRAPATRSEHGEP